MKTGDFIYEDGSSSSELDKNKKVVGVWCNVTDDHGCAVSVIESKGELQWQEAQDFCNENNMRCPTIDELTGIYLNRNKINISLKQAKLPKLRDVYYWSSTEYYSTNAWRVAFRNGSRNNYTKYTTYYVRPVLAL